MASFSDSPNFSKGLLLSWIVCCLLGFWLLAIHAYTPGASGKIDLERLETRKVAEGLQLLMFVHPGCPCTPASIDELGEVLHRAGSEITDIQFYVDVPSMTVDEETEKFVNLLLRTAPGATIHYDIGGEVSSGFGAYTSGYIILRSESETPLFAGGITGSRGHRGDNPGRHLLLNAILNQETPGKSPVFGCELQSSLLN